MSPASYLLRLCRWFRRHPLPVAVIAACLVVEAAFNAFVPVAIERLIDDAIAPRDGRALATTLAALGGGAVIASALGLLGDRLYARLYADVVGRVRMRLFDHLQTLGPTFFARHAPGDLAARFSTDIASVEQTLASWIAWGWKPALDVLGYTAVMFTIDWRLALLAQLLWPAVLLGPRWLAPRAAAAAEDKKRHEAAALDAVDEAVTGRQVMRAFGVEATFSRRFAALVTRVANSTARGAFLGGALERSAGFGIMALQLAVLGAGAAWALAGQISAGELAAFASVFTATSHALLYLAQYATTLFPSAAGLARVEEVLAARSDVADRSDARPLPPFARSIRLRGVTYEPELGVRVLDGVDLEIERGQYVALVGPSGSGKSTVLNALMRNFDPQRGAVEIDGRDLRGVTRASLVAQTAVVFQDSFLFNLSVRDNVRLGRLDASDAEVEAACRNAEIHDTVVALADGYETIVGPRGSWLSGGQRQRLAIARALLRDPRVLLLDEVTSALDAATEQAIGETLARLARGRTVVSVTHRLPLTFSCDRVHVLEAGRVVESGAPRELLARGGSYASLWHKQEGLNVSADGLHASITVERLRRLPLLAELDDGLLELLARFQLVTETHPAGRDVVVEGDHADKFYFIVRGRVEVLRRQPNGRVRRIEVLEDGDNFGEAALLRNTSRTATVRTLVPSVFLTLQREPFRQLLERAPQVRAALVVQDVARTAAG